MYLAAVPTAYSDAVMEYKKNVGSAYLLSPATHQLLILQISTDAMLAPNFERHEIILCLINNCIPVEWMNHAYPYRVQYI